MIKSYLIPTFICITFLFSCNPKQEEKEAPTKYSVTSPLVIDTFYTKEYVAQIQAIQNIEIRSKVKGFLDGIETDEGKKVVAGQLLFSIRPLEFQADLMKAKAKVREAELDVQNEKKLADKDIVSKSELATAVAKFDEAKAEVATASIYLNYTKIRAPFSGVLDRIKFKKGSLIDDGGILTTLSNNSEMYAYFNVTEVEYLNYMNRKNDNNKNNATLILANNEPHKYPGIIETIEGEFDNNTGNIAFRAKFPNPELLLKHGQTGKVKLVVPITNAIIIPQKATYDVLEKTYVYVLDKDNKVKSRNITIGQKLSNLYIIIAGLNADDKILIDGLQSVKEDEKIEAKVLNNRAVINELQLIK